MRPVLPLWAVLACATVLTTGEDIREHDVSTPRPVGGAPPDAGPSSRDADNLYDHNNNIMYLMEILDNNENSDVPSSIEETLRLLKKGEEEIVLKDEYRDLVLLLGNTGAGKTASTLWIAADDDELFSVKISPGQFLIKDRHGKIGNSTITSTTIFPDFVLNKKTDTGHYDLPGFSDTRSSSYDIANTYFIKKVLDHSNSTKLVVVVSYPSVRQGVDRQDFMKLLKHITELVKTIAKYKNSISMIVTKIDNIYIETENGLKLLDDKAVNEGIAIFLREVKGDLERNLNHPNVTEKDQIFYKNGLDLIDVLLVQDGELYPQIGLFRRPNKDGPLKDIPILQKQKVHVQEYIHNKLVFTQTSREDFGYTISDKSQNDINDLADEIFRNVISIVKQLANNMHMYQKQLIQTLQDKIDKLVISDTNSVDVKFKEIQNLFNKLNNGQNTISKLADEIKKNVKTPNSLAAAINRTLNDLNIGASTNVASINVQGKYILFLQEVSGKDLSKNTNPLAWASPFQTITTELFGPIEAIKKSVSNIENQINKMTRSDIKKSVQKMRNYFINKEKDISDIINLQIEYNSSYKKLLGIQQKANSDTPMDYLQQLITGMNIRFSDHTTTNIVQNSIYFQFLKATMDIELNYLNDSQNWYKFVDNVYDQLSNYEIQKDTKVCSDLSNEITHADEGKTVEDTRLENFLKKCYRIDYEPDYNNIKNITLDKYKIRSLEKVFTLTLKKSYSYECEPNGKLVIKGIYLKVSDVAHKACAEPTKLIEIFALHKIFIDSNLNQIGKKVEVSIIAPVWDVQGDYELLLQGAPGKAHSDDTANNGIGQGQSGDDGMPGLPGGPGGNFLGIVDQVDNGNKLTVITDGGTGGRGQNAGNGVSGNSGGIPKLTVSRKDGWFGKGNFNLIQEGSDWLSLGYVAFQTSGMPSGPGSSTIYSHYYVYGTNCTNGGSGGNGGYRGSGGNPGIVNIIPLSRETNVNVSNNTGLVGESSEGGRGAYGGSSGGHIKVWQILDSVLVYTWATYKIVDQHALNVCVNGRNGDNNNRHKIKEPEDVTFLHQSLMVNDFKVYLKDNIAKTMRESFLRQFLDKIENSASIQDLQEIK